MSESASEYIRVSERTKERLRRRKRSEESFNDVIERLLDDNGDLLAGFGAREERTGETLAETVARLDLLPRLQSWDSSVGNPASRLPRL